ncbi:MAG TPA: hypothetical protein PLV21_03915 [Cyclobacteriaceae bacterium]|nr:hypothetical protein [Cyclobacteriaceae bacterium]HRJ81006.1 hypothetical protein [Cyclobacteriaceae bacterium]
MEVPEEQRQSNVEGPLISLVRSLINCTNYRETQRLQTAFYDCLAPKFFDRLKKAASLLYNGISDWEARTEEVFNDTFRIAFEKFKTFEVGENWDDEECRKVLLNWMSEIANNLLLKLARSDKKDKKNFNRYLVSRIYDDQLGDDLTRKSYKPTYDKVKFDKFWKSLNAMAKDILLICIENGTIKAEGGDHNSDKEIGLLKLKNETDGCATPKEVRKYLEQKQFKERNTDHLPDEALEALKAKYNVKPAAIRKAKQRALEGLRNCKI